MHWLVRIVERAGLSAAEDVEVSPQVSSPDAWAAVTRSYGLVEARLAELVAEYFRLDVADLANADPNAALVIPEGMARKHHIYPLLEDDRHIYVATCDPTDVEAERALGFSTGRTTVFQVATPGEIRDELDARFTPGHHVEGILGSFDSDDLDLSLDVVQLVEEMGPEAVTEEDAKRPRSRSSPT